MEEMIGYFLAVGMNLIKESGWQKLRIAPEEERAVLDTQKGRCKHEI